MERWIDSCRSIGEKPLPVEVERRLLRDARRTGLRLKFAIALPPIVLVLGIAAVIAVYAMSLGTPSFREVVVMAAVLLPIIALVAGIFLAIDAVRLRWRAWRDLRRGVIEEFTIDRTHRALSDFALDAGLRGPSMPQSLLVLPGTKRLVARDEKQLRHFESVQIVELARIDDDASYRPVEHSRIAGSEPRRRRASKYESLREHATAKRTLNAAEIRELRNHRRRDITKCASMSFTALFLSFAALMMVTGHTGSGSILVQVGIPVFIAMSMWMIYATAASALRLSRDIASGYVLVLVRTPSEDRGEASSRMPIRHIEVLPRSGREWTHDDAPASWRVHG